MKAKLSSHWVAKPAHVKYKIGTINLLLEYFSFLTNIYCHFSGTTFWMLVNNLKNLNFKLWSLGRIILLI